MSPKTKFNVHDTSDLPIGSISDLKVEEVKTKSSTTKARFKKAEKPTETPKKPTQSSKSTNSNTVTKKAKDSSSSSVEKEDLETLNEQNIRQFRFRNRRNKLIIAILSILLAISLVVIIVYASVTVLKNNSFLYTHGDANAVYIVDGKELTEFRSPPSVKGNTVYQFNLQLDIKSQGEYNIRFEIHVYQGEELLNNILIYEPNTTLFTKSSKGYVSRSPISGGQTIDLCQGVILDIEYSESLDISNFKMEIHTYFE